MYVCMYVRACVCLIILNIKKKKITFLIFGIVLNLNQIYIHILSSINFFFFLAN